MSIDVSTEESTIEKIASKRVKGFSGSRLLKIFASLADQAVVSGVRFVTTMLIVRTAGTAVVGNYSMSFYFLLIAMAVQDALICAPFNLFNSLGEGDQKKKYHGSVLMLVGMVGILSSIAFVSVWGMGQFLGHTSGLNAAMGALALTVPFVLLREFARRVELARLRVGTAFCIDAVSSSLQVLFLWMLIRLSTLSISGVYFAMAASSALAAFVWLVVAFRETVFCTDTFKSELKRHWAVGKWPLFAQVVGIMQVFSVLWVIKWLLGDATAGIFATCNYVVLFVNPIALGVCNSLSPMAVSSFREGGAVCVRRLIWIAMVVMGGGVSLFALVTSWYSDQILVGLYTDPAFLGKGMLMFFLGINMALSVAHMMNDQGVWAIERPKWLLRSTVITFVITFVLSYPLIRLFELEGAAVSLIVGRSVGLLYQTWLFFMTRQDDEVESAPTGQTC